MYAKIINGVFYKAPKMLPDSGNHVYNPSAEMYAAAGYKPVVFTDAPDDAPEGYYYTSGWEEQEYSIVQTWTLEELPDEVSADEIEAALQEVLA